VIFNNCKKNFINHRRYVELCRATLNMQCIKNVFGRGCAVARNFAREGFDLPFPLLSAPAANAF